MLTVIDDTHRPRRQPLTPWELPSLLTSVHSYRRSRKKAETERKHFPAVLGFVYRNRFAVASQIQRRFSGILRSDRTTRRHLEELESQGYLAIAPARGVGPLFPKIYYVTGRGGKKLRESLAAQGKSWQTVCVDRRSHDSCEGYSADRILHEILTTEFMLSIWQTINGRADLELLTIQRRSLVKHPAFRLEVRGRHTRLVPDAMFLFRQTGRGMVCCFVEMDNGTMNAKQIAAKYHRYAAWSDSKVGQQYLLDLYHGHGATNPRPTFRLLIVARSRTGKDDERRMLELQRPHSRLPTSLQNKIWFTTVADLCHWQHNPLPLDATIWRRGLDDAQKRRKKPLDDSHQEKETILWSDSSSIQLHKLFMESVVDAQSVYQVDQRL